MGGSSRSSENLLVNDDETNAMYENEVNQYSRDGTGELSSSLLEEDDYSFIDYDYPSEHGDYRRRNRAPYDDYSDEDDDTVYPVDEPYIIDRKNAGGLGNSSYRRSTDYLSDVSDSDEDGYIPISMLLSNDDLEREDWYDDPRGEDFRTAFACLKTRRTLAKKYLLDILRAPEEDGSKIQVDQDPAVQDEITYALSEILIPGLAKMSVQKLCNLLVKYPNLDLRGYLLDLDVYTIAYVIWGIDFYMNRKFGDSVDEEPSQENSIVVDEKKNPPIGDSGKSIWENWLDWLMENVRPLVTSQPPVTYDKEKIHRITNKS